MMMTAQQREAEYADRYGNCEFCGTLACSATMPMFLPTHCESGDELIIALSVEGKDTNHDH